jgi:uncharacterized damage-inducible protein DinB
MDQEPVAALYARDLLKLAEEIGLFKNEEDLWAKSGEIANASGNLCLHINGNLNHFIGAILGDTGYIRDREQEFSATQHTRQSLINMTLYTSKTILPIIKTLSTDKLEQTYPLLVFGETMTTRYFLLHLYGHLNYHLGQINYLRRML